MLKFLKFIYSSQLAIRKAIHAQIEQYASIVDRLARIETILADNQQKEISYLSAKEVENFVGFSDSSLRRHQEAGRLKVAKTGKNRTRYYDKEEVIRFKIWYWNLPSDFT